jgi:hypothetical protein
MDSSPQTCALAGNIAAVGPTANRMMRKPITAFQNPTTIHGKVMANGMSVAISKAPNPPGDRATTTSHDDRAIVTTHSKAKIARRADMLFSTTSPYIACGGVMASISSAGGADYSL